MLFVEASFLAESDKLTKKGNCKLSSVIPTVPVPPPPDPPLEFEPPLVAAAPGTAPPPVAPLEAEGEEVEEHADAKATALTAMVAER